MDLNISVSQIYGNWDNYVIPIGRKIKVDLFSYTDQNSVIIVLLKTIQIKKIEARLLEEQSSGRIFEGTNEYIQLHENGQLFYVGTHRHTGCLEKNYNLIKSFGPQYIKFMSRKTL